MASKTTRHALTVIGLAHGVADSIEASYRQPPKTVAGHISKIRQRCQECFKVWPDELEGREVKKINDRMKVLDDIMSENHAPVTVLTSLALALLDDLESMVPEHKRPPVSRLLIACRQVHRYYDRHLDKWEHYDMAVHAVNALEKLAA